MAKEISLEALLDKYLDKAMIVSIAEERGLSTKGYKKDLITKVVSEMPSEDLLYYFSAEKLQEILEGLGAKKSGSKSELVERLASLISVSLVVEAKRYLEGITITIKLNNERDLERYLFGGLEEFFRGKKAKIIPQSVGTKGRKPDIIIEREEETVVVELKYITTQSEYTSAIGQTIGYGRDFANAKVILFCYDPDKKLKK